MKGLAKNLFALAVASATLATAAWMGMRWAAFAAVVIGVFFVGYALTYALLWLGLRGRALAVVSTLTAPLWLIAGVGIANVTYQTPVQCGSGFGAVPFKEVAGAPRRDVRGRASGPCLPRAIDVGRTLVHMVRTGEPPETGLPRVRRGTR